jgi:hypothetical protein
MTWTRDPRDEGVSPVDDRPDLLRLAQDITDERPIDWESETPRLGDLASTGQRLRDLQRVAQAYRKPWAGDSPAAAEPAPAARTVLFTWGPLQVLEQLGVGSFGEVYRAFDPTLQREVALKLRRTGGERFGTGARRFIDEARRLARVRDPHVLFVHGADVHEGRVGIWTDLVDGKTLEEWIAAHGVMGAQEAAVVGLGLCRALAAVHAAGLVHGDLKAQNVMRERGGRIILMDFGSVSDLPRGASEAPEAAGIVDPLIFGTPLTMAPEVLAGERPSAASDLYALGVLLYRLVSGRYPVSATTQDELSALHARGESTPLRDVRADLPAAFVQVVQRALSRDPQARFASAGAMEAALAQALPPAAAVAASAAAGLTAGAAALVDGTGRTPARRATPRSQRWVWATAVAAVALAAVAVPLEVRRSGRSSAPPTPAPLPSAGGRPLATAPPVAGPGSSGAPDAATLPASATFYRVRDGARETLLAGSWIAPGDHLFLELQPQEPLHVYVINEDEHGELFVLFPVAGLSPANPLAAGVKHRLPGHRGEVAQDWQVSSAGGTESFLLVAARAPVPLLEDEIRRQQSADPARPVVYALLNLQALRNTRGVGTLVDAAADSLSHSRSRIQQLVDLLSAGASAQDGVWVRMLEVNNPGS